MNKQSRQKFMTIFNDMLNDRQGNQKLEQILQLSSKGDEVDNLNTQKEQSLSVRLDQRNILFLKKVEEAKQKILDGSYGECEDCGDGISQKRLLARPTACLCINCQEEKEREEFNNFNKRRDLTSKKLKEENSHDHIIRDVKFNSVSDIAFESVIDL
jgi:DnaK suppressor protein